MERLDLLARIGAVGADGGITRPGLSTAEDEAHALVAGWCEEAGMAVSRDRSGNLYARPSGSEAAAEIWSGSHLDTVPSGGRFDGALGVVAAIEAVAEVAADRPGSPLAVVVFRDEEGWRFGDGCFGSRCLAGQVGAEDLARRDSAGVSVAEALAALGLAGPPVEAALPAAYVEAHIEQGPILASAGAAVGDVAGIVGIAGFDLTFHGASGHAGTVPMADRNDAFSACAELALRLRERALEIPGSVATIGDVSVAALLRTSSPVPSARRSTSGPRAARLSTPSPPPCPPWPPTPPTGTDAASTPPAAGAPSRSSSRAAFATPSAQRREGSGSRSPSSSRAPATTPVSLRLPGSTPGCSSCGA